MGRPTGSANLPLHRGRVPQWLAQRMQALGRVIAEAIVIEYGRDEFLRRLSHPFWFQSFGSVMGMDWHSSGITTSVMGALKVGLAPVASELGLWVCGGRGRHSRATPEELLAVAECTGLPGDELAATSRLVAKIDNAAVQDGFTLYLHSFVLAADGQWVVVQQGMNPDLREARRYHWLSRGLESFVDRPHAAIEGRRHGPIVDLTHPTARASRQLQLELLQRDPDAIVTAWAEVREPRILRTPDEQLALPHLSLPHHHDVRRDDVDLRRLRATLRAAAERGPADYPALLGTPGLGARTLYALALVAEVIHGAPCRFSDPARFSTALGGKDGHPFPVPLDVYDETLVLIRRAVRRAKLGSTDQLAALRRIDAQARAVADHVDGLDFGNALRQLSP